MGDAVYEVRIRRMLVERDPENVDRLHHEAVRYVSCGGQAKAIRAMLANAEAAVGKNAPTVAGGAADCPLILTEDEVRLVKRARNHRAMSRPKNADPREYKLATGFEALLGYLFLDNQLERMIAVVDEAVRLIDAE
ncbi:MAG: Mini-ribonuclease 3 [Mogibacterium sp.]|nr:Mini-ribonuclease 3 [Mogibacterium sp.]